MITHNSSFVWDPEKESANIHKHRVDFSTASKAFKDTQRKIYTDTRHSAKEERFFCIGKVESRILTVRFTYRNGKIRIIGAGYWRKGKKYYEKEFNGPE
ncbi:MAG: BrnT family toxin [Elusimicrobia bacterium]|nr:BrnT family toxin [Elusimicrobiota bacterium]